MTVDDRARDDRARHAAEPSMRAVAESFGLPGPVTEVGRVAQAWSNRVYRMATGGGCYAVKQLLNPWQDPGWLDWLTEAAAFELHAWQAGIRMPEPIRTPTGAVFADVPDTDGLGTVTVRVHRWVDGEPCPPGPVPVGQARQVGSDLARMHQLAHRPGRTDVFPTIGADQIDHWDELVDRLAGPAPDLARATAAVEPAVRAIGRLLADADTDHGGGPMSHGDVDQKNLILTAAGPVLCDWDVAAPWIPRQELARTALSLAVWQDPAVARAVIDGYAAAGGIRCRLQPTDLASDLVIGLDWVVLCLERAAGLRDDGPQRRQEAVEAVPRLLDGIPAQLDRVLAVEDWLRT
jgi:Ser/Thr protein kinase RdoA (MazF antagonist)